MESRKEGDHTRLEVRPTVLAAVLTLALSGCLRTPSTSCTDAAACPAAYESSNLPQVPTPLEARWEGCRGMVGLVDALRGSVEQLLPDAFLLPGSGPLVSLQVEALACRRAVLDRQTFDEAALFEVFVTVEPRNASWTSGAPSRFVLDAVVQPQALADGLTPLGFNAHVALWSEQRTDLPLVGMATHVWSYRSDPLQVRMELASLAGQTSTSSWRSTSWMQAPEAIRRMTATQTYQFDGIPEEAGLLSVEGPLHLASLMPGCCASWRGQSYRETDVIWTADPQIFSA